MRLQLGGQQAVLQRLRRVQGAVQQELQNAIHATALSVQTTAQRKIQRGPKTGTTYYRIPGANYLTIRADSDDGAPVAFVGGGGSHNLSATHQASAPGEAPATDTGGLASSIAMVLGTRSAQVGTGLIYARYLELGTQRIEPRPFLYPSLLENAEAYRRRLRGLADRAARRVQ